MEVAAIRRAAGSRLGTGRWLSGHCKHDDHDPGDLEACRRLRIRSSDATVRGTAGVKLLAHASPLKGISIARASHQRSAIFVAPDRFPLPLLLYAGLLFSFRLLMLGWSACMHGVFLEPTCCRCRNIRGGTRTRNLLLRREAPYPLGHTSYCVTGHSRQYMDLYVEPRS